MALVTKILFFILLVAVAVEAGEKTTAVLGIGANVASTLLKALAPNEACFIFYEHAKYQGNNEKVCGKRGKCLKVNSLINTVSSIDFVSDGRIVGVEKMRGYSGEHCETYKQETESLGEYYAGFATIWDDGYHRCDGYDMQSSSCDTNYNDNIRSFSFS